MTFLCHREEACFEEMALYCEGEDSLDVIAVFAASQEVV